jgi:flagellar FliL protein
MAVCAALVVGGAGGMFFMLKRLPPAAAVKKAGAAAAGEEGKEAGAAGSEAKEEAKAEPKEEGKEEGKEGGEHEAKGPGDTDGAVVTMQPFIINLTDETGEPRYLKMTVAVELASHAWEKGFEHQTPRVRNALLMYMGNLKVGDILGTANRKALVDHLRTEVQAILGKRGVHDVYLTEFVIQ